MAKRDYYNYFWYLSIASISFVLGWLMTSNISQSECNEFIIDEFYSQSYSECQTRCDNLTGEQLSYKGKIVTIFDKGLLYDFNYSLISDIK